jgi:aminoglycoside phosphotransferase (APT) family kinase protein
MEPDEVREGLTSFIRRQTGARAVGIENLVRLSGGASRETWAFDATIEGRDGKRREELIFRCDPFEGTPISTGRALEHHLISAAWKAGVVVPEPRWDGDETFPVKFFVMKRVPGEALGSRLIRGEQYEKARGLLPGQLATSLARVHSIRKADHPELAALQGPEPGVPPAKSEVELWEKHYRTATPNPHPVLEVAFRWLRANLPEPRAEALVHGDYRLGNFLYTEEGLQGIVDWELAHWGDPMEDIGWLSVRSWRFGGKGPVAGLASREDFYRLYEEAGGEPVDRERTRFWEVFGNLRWGIITIAQALAYLSGRSKSVELASIGRRTAETEYELLNLIGEAR